MSAPVTNPPAGTAGAGVAGSGGGVLGLAGAVADGVGSVLDGVGAAELNAALNAGLDTGLLDTAALPEEAEPADGSGADEHAASTRPPAASAPTSRARFEPGRPQRRRDRMDPDVTDMRSWIGPTDRSR
jgi:hypothetical protein